MNLTETLLRIQKNTHWANLYMPLEWPIQSGLKWAQVGSSGLVLRVLLRFWAAQEGLSWVNFSVALLQALSGGLPNGRCGCCPVLCLLQGTANLQPWLERCNNTTKNKL